MKPLLSLCLSLLCIATAAQAQNEATLSGKFPAEAGKNMMLSGANHFQIAINADYSGSFNTTFNIAKGYYLLNYTGHSYYIYLEPAMNLTITKADSTLNFSGQGSAQNNLIKQLSAVAIQYFKGNGNDLPTGMTTIEPADFNKIMENYRADALKVLARQQFGDFFNHTQAAYIDYRVRQFNYLYLQRYGIDPAKDKEATTILANRPPGLITPEYNAKIAAAITARRVKMMPAYDRNQFELKIWNDFDIDDEAMFNYSSKFKQLLDIRLTQLLNAEYAVAPYLRAKNHNEMLFDVVKKRVSNTVIRENLLNRYILLILKAGDKDAPKYYQDYMSLATDQIYIAAVKETYATYKMITPGSMAPDFTYADINNNKVSLSSFKGKYIYIDVWAQWCAPCKNEIPSLKVIEKRYENQKIKFISLSVDYQKDAAKWKKYVLDNNLDGTQVMADMDFQSDFIKKFNINSIPRFILIDPDGKIVSANADRPSNPALQTLLDKLLDKI